MGPFLLVLLTLNPRTGELTGSTVVGRPYVGITECMRAAIDQGPQHSAGGSVGVWVCRAETPDKDSVALSGFDGNAPGKAADRDGFVHFERRDVDDGDVVG